MLSLANHKSYVVSFFALFLSIFVFGRIFLLCFLLSLQYDLPQIIIGINRVIYHSKVVSFVT